MEQGDFKRPSYDNENPEWKEKFIRQDSELIHWLDEFMESSEYAAAVNRKICTDNITGKKKTPTRSVERKSLKKKKGHKKEKNKKNSITPVPTMQLIEEGISKVLTRLKLPDVIANQRQGIEIIRQKILEVKNKHIALVARESMMNTTMKRRAQQMLRHDFHVNIQSDKLSTRILDKIQRVRNIRKRHASSQEANRVEIVAKLLRELKLCKKTSHIHKSRITTIRRHKSKTTTSITIDEELSYIPVVEESIEDESYITPSFEDSKTKTKSQSKKDEKKAETDKKEKSKKPETTKQNKKDEKKSKSSSKNTTKTEPDVLPLDIPCVNTRQKYYPLDDLNHLLEDIRKFYKYLKEKENYELQLRLSQELHLPLDPGFYSNPNKIIFKDYEPGKIYKKTISVINGGPHAKKLIVDRVTWNGDIEEENLLEVEQFDICKIIPGLSTRITLKFSPEVLNRTTDGNIIFITQNYNSDQPFCAFQYILHVVCIPKCAAVLIKPIIISFDEMPIWRAQKMKKAGKNFKLITIANNGLKECKVVISKIHNTQTVEQEWRKIISIIRVDDFHAESKTISRTTVDENDFYEDEQFPRNLVQQCVENVFNTFKFERNIFIVQPKSSVTIKCFFKEMREPGYDAESYTFSIYERFQDGQLYCIGTQDVIVNAETTEHFLQSNVEILDFEVCAYGSAYQLDFELQNPCKLPHHVQITFPLRMRPYLQTNTHIATLQPESTIKVGIKFLPDAGMTDENKYYDSNLSLFEFPVYVRIKTKGYKDTPPLKIDVFAVAINPKSIFLTPIEPGSLHFHGNDVDMNLGECTVNDTIYTEILIENCTIMPQHFGFLNLPQYVILQPNHGFGLLQPMEKRKLRVLISPTLLDVQSQNEPVHFTLIPTTIKHCGRLRMREDKKILLKRLKQMEEYFCRSRHSIDIKLREDIESLRDYMRSSHSHHNTLAESNPTIDRIIKTFDSTEQLMNIVEYDIAEEKTRASSLTDDESEDKPYYPAGSHEIGPFATFSYHFNVFDAYIEFSHQLIHFPDTPCGSTSCMSIQLIGKRCLPVGPKFKANFLFLQSSDAQLTVQPTFGYITGRSKREICLIMRPKFSRVQIEQHAQLLKYQSLMKAFLEEQEKRDTEEESNIIEKKGTIKEEKIGKSPKKAVPGKKNKAAMPAIEDIVVHDDELHQAELDIYRSIEPYDIEAILTCQLTLYEISGPPIKRSTENLLLKATCHVVQPNMIHDQPFQIIDFGAVTVGMSVTKTINIQNIQQKQISVKLSPLNPVGPFNCRPMLSTSIEPQEAKGISIKFAPFEEKLTLEYLDIISDHTQYSFMLNGLGVQPQILFNPSFLVYRLTSAAGTSADCKFDILNNSQGKVEIKLERVSEMEGKISEFPQIPETEKKPTKPTKTIKKSKITNELYPDEIQALSTDFKVHKGPSRFHVMGNFSRTETYLVEPFTKCNVHIRFGDTQNEKATGSAATSKGDKKSMNTSKSNKSLKASKSSSFNIEKGKTYVIKYNIFSGLLFLKDIIIIVTVT